MWGGTLRQRRRILKIMIQENLLRKLLRDFTYLKKLKEILRDLRDFTIVRSHYVPENIAPEQPTSRQI